MKKILSIITLLFVASGAFAQSAKDMLSNEAQEKEILQQKHGIMTAEETRAADEFGINPRRTGVAEISAST